jgi:hypothetical protein
MLKLAIASVALFSTVAALPLAGASGAAAFLLPRDYLQPQYMSPPSVGADYVFVSGEPILFNLELWNEKPDVIRLLSGQARPEQLIDVVLLKQDGQNLSDVPVRLSQAAPVRINGQGRSVEMPWTSPFELPVKGSLVVPLEVVSDAARAPGIYQLRLRGIAASCEPECAIRDQAGLFRFEVRDASAFTSRVELLTRRAWNATANSRLEEAQSAITDLLAFYPQSVFGHQLQGQVAEKRKQWDKAVTEYSAAVQILVRQDDQLYARARPNDVRERLDGLRTMLSAATQKRARK